MPKDVTREIEPPFHKQLLRSVDPAAAHDGRITDMATSWKTNRDICVRSHPSEGREGLL